jgi:hypothetical protein
VFADAASTFATNFLTVLRNGSTIEGQAEDLVLNVNKVVVWLIYDGTTWQVASSGGPSGISGYSGLGLSGFSGTSGQAGPGTSITATDDNSTVTLYPVMVGAAGSAQTPKVDASTTPLSYNALTGTLIVPGYLDTGVTDTITAAGSVQGNATVLTTEINNVTTVTAGTGVILPLAIGGLRVVVRNGGANALNVYPNTSDSINAAAVNVAYALPVGGCIEFIAMNATNWYTLNATYV